MNINCNYSNIFLALCLAIAIQVPSNSQSFLAASAASAKLKNITLGEAVANPETPLLLELVTKAGLMPVLTSSESYTFFVPSEKALLSYRNSSPEALKSLLSQHIVAGSLTSDDLKDGATLKTLAGESLRIYRKKEAILVNGMRLENPNQLYSNGIWHQLRGCIKSNKSEL